VKVKGEIIKEAVVSEYFLKLNLFLLGFVALVAQTVLYRETLIFVQGNELTLGPVLSIWLLGGALAGFFCARAKKSEKFLKTLHFFLIFSLPLSLLIVRVVGAVLLPFGKASSFFLVFLLTLFSLFPMNFFLTAEFLVCMALISREKAGGVGFSYFLETLGAFTGALIFTFILSFYWLSSGVIVFLSLLLVLISFFLFSGLKKVFPLALALILASSLFFLPQFEALTRGFYFLGWVLSQDSPIQNITLTRVSREFSPGKARKETQLFLNGQLSGFSGGYNLLVQLPAHLPLALVENPKRVLVVGGLASGLVREVLKHPVKEVVVLELDPEVVEVVKAHYPPGDISFFKDKRLRVIFVDARRFLKSHRSRYDVIIFDLPGPQNILLARLYTAEFIKEIRQHLNPGGVFSFLFPGSEEYLSRETRLYSGSLIATLKTSFPQVIATPAVGSLLIASIKRKKIFLPFIFDVLKRRKVKVGFDPVFLESAFERTLYFQRKFEGNFPINTDERPVSIFLNSLIFQKISGSSFQYLDDFFLAHPYFLVILVFSPLLLFLFPQRRPLSVVFSAGLAGMVAEISLIYLFQLNIGYVYSQVGLLLAFFMLGLSLGGYFFKDKSGYLLEMAAGLGLLLLFLPLIPRLQLFAYSLYFYFILLGLSGFLVGAVFPLSVTFMGREKSGLVYSVDLLGGALGAFLTGAFLLPLLGLRNSSFLVALLLSVSAFFLIFPRKPGR